jgi:hypothetical protein
LLGFAALTPVVVIVWGTLNNRDIRTARQPEPADSGGEALQPRMNA